MFSTSRPVLNPLFYVACLPCGTGPRLLLGLIVKDVLRGRAFIHTRETMAAKLGRHPVTITRWVRVLRERGWVRVVRKRRRDANLYLLAPRLWARLTGRRTPKYPSELATVLHRLGLRAGVSPSRMRRAGVRP